LGVIPLAAALTRFAAMALSCALGKLEGFCKDFMPATIVCATFNILSVYSIY
jgi:hypothetical protein